MFFDQFDQALIDFFFRVLNVGVLIAVGVYLFKRYGIDAIAEQMGQQERHKKVLQDQKTALAQERELAQKAAHEQELLARRLRTNMVRWQEQFGKQVAMRAQEKERLLQVLAHKSAVQQQQLAADVAADRVFARSIAQARAQLGKQFADARAGQEFVHDIVVYLKKSAS